MYGMKVKSQMLNKGYMEDTMKKEYKKPIIEIEKYTLSSNIASSCNVGNAGNVDINESIDFFTSMGWTYDEVIEKLKGDGTLTCYHSSQGINVFNS